ncbi:MAG: tRNA (adenosine(37)-N6)-dimethylallyltransferase MiaA [Hellea sp.]|nr:tRNA (adenosine(37)-N6)-dimethylallyltransferase MiaA [Hellea sp.]
MKPIICIAGPTASGKSAWAIQIAKSFSGEIINTDALQVYSELNIISARPSKSEMLSAPHHLFGHVDSNFRYSVGNWISEVENLIIDILARGKSPILTGGTGLYFRSLIEGIAKIPIIPSDIILETNKFQEQNGVEGLRNLAGKLDPKAASRVLGKDPHRLMRIINVYKATNKPISFWQENTKPVVPRIFCHCAVLLPERQKLYDAINNRFDLMMKKGLLNEAERIFTKNIDPTLPIMKAIGLREFFPYFSGDISLDEAVHLAKRNSRRFAKRQFTWFRGQLKNWNEVKTEVQRKNFEEIIPHKV